MSEPDCRILELAYIGEMPADQRLSREDLFSLADVRMPEPGGLQFDLNSAIPHFLLFQEVHRCTTVIWRDLTNQHKSGPSAIAQSNHRGGLASPTKLGFSNDATTPKPRLHPTPIACVYADYTIVVPAGGPSTSVPGAKAARLRHHWQP